MAYFDNMNKKHMSKQEHMRQDARKADEGTEYRGFKAKGGHGTQKMDMYRKDERGGYHGGYKQDRPAESRNGGYKQDRPAESRNGGYKQGRPAESRSAGPRKDANDRRDYGNRGKDDRRPATYQRPEQPRDERRSVPVHLEGHHATIAHAVATLPKPVQPADEMLENLLTGRNPIREALKSGRDIEKLMVAKGDLSGTAREIIAMAREAHIPVQMVERVRLDELARNHQGMIAFASAYHYADVDDMLRLAESRNEDPFLIILDGVTDPHNLGAVIRTAAAVGAHGVIVPERRAVGLTPAAVKASAGGIEHIPVARVINLTNEIKRLKARGIWMFGADAGGENYHLVNFSGPCALIIGSEGDGISRLVREQCDHIVAIPMHNPAMESLNASVAAGILMSAVAAMRE